MTETYSFGEWLKQRRTALRLTQRETAVRTHCSLAMLKKSEADERRPSPELADLLATAPGLTLVVTSRERLDLAEEWLFPVPGLADDAAVALFAQQSRRVKPDFDATAEETAVTRICQLVAGHALAVELAASWTRSMSGSQVAARIQQDLDFMAGGARNTAERHRSLRAMFDHSWALLTATEQAVLPTLAISWSRCARRWRRQQRAITRWRRRCAATWMPSRTRAGLCLCRHCVRK